MINRIIASFLLLALVSANLSRFFIYAEFELNQKFIAAKLCENKDKPKLQCNGKCYLKKKLKDAEEKEKKQEEANQKNGTQFVSIIHTPAIISFVGFTPEKDKPSLLFFVLPEFSSEIPHPPPAVG